VTTQAISAYGVQLRLGNGIALAAVNITAATNATPIVVTTASPHGIPLNSVVIAGVTGNTGANGVWVVQALTTTTVRLRGSIGNGAYGGGGTMQRSDTYTVIAEITDIQDAGLSVALVETTAHDGSGYASRIPTFLSGNMMRIACNWVPAHATHNATTGLTFLLNQRVTRRYLLVWPDAARTAWLMFAWVTMDTKAAPVAGALTSQIQLEIDGAPLLAA
jgi:hypothetical protein